MRGEPGPDNMFDDDTGEALEKVPYPLVVPACACITSEIFPTCPTLVDLPYLQVLDDGASKELVKEFQNYEHMLREMWSHFLSFRHRLCVDKDLQEVQGDLVVLLCGVIAQQRGPVRRVVTTSGVHNIYVGSNSITKSKNKVQEMDTDIAR